MISFFVCQFSQMLLYLHLQVASSNVLVEKMKKSEREVIQDWLENIFKSWEKTNDLEVTLFKFTPLKRGDASLVSGNDVHE